MSDSQHVSRLESDDVILTMTALRAAYKGTDANLKDPHSGFACPDCYGLAFHIDLRYSDGTLRIKCAKCGGGRAVLAIKEEP